MVYLMALGEPTTTWRTRRQAQARDEIIVAAWELAEREGIANLSLREVAAAVGMQPPSLYSYFASKHAIYDAMFEQGYTQMLEQFEPPRPRETPRRYLERTAREFIAFCQERPARYQLMFQPAVAGFHPSESAYAPSVAVIDRVSALLTELGVRHRDALDLWTALVGGLAAQQVANDPTGDRWVRLVPQTVSMFLSHTAPQLLERKKP